MFFGFFPPSTSYLANIDFVNSNTNSWLNISNTGNNKINTKFEIILPPEIVLNYSLYPYDSIVNNTIYYSKDSLDLFESINFQISTNPINAGIINNNDTILYSFSLKVFDLNNNLISTSTDSLSSLVICSYDPNLKTPLPNGDYGGVLIQPTGYLEYIIEFQNTGSAPANDIIIKDTLSQNVDISTFEFISASHNSLVSINNEWVLQIKYEDINLIDSTTNDTLSHGYFKYKIISVR